MFNVRKTKWLRGKSFFGKLIRMPLSLIPKGTVIRIIGGPIKGWRWIKGSHNDSVWMGVYERSQSKNFFNLAGGCDVFFDLGAHAGYYSLLYKAANPNGKVFSFEPFEANYNFFERHMKLNGVKNVVVFNKAVSNVQGVLRFLETKSSVAGKLAETGNISVDVIKLSEWISTGRLPTPNLLKIDIEGAESKVLKDLYQVLAASHPTIFLSTHGQNVHEECLQLLRELNYRLVPLDHVEIEKAREVLVTV
jgi:FkbM family methyltransferase